MLKQRREDKAADTFTGGLHGKTVHRRDLEDSDRPGHLREGLLLEPDQWTAAQRFGLRTPSGRSIGFIEPTRDLREPLFSEAPADLRRRVEATQVVLDGVHARIQAALDERVAGEVAWREAAARGDGGGYDRGLAREMAAQGQQKALDPEEALARTRLSDASEAVRRWLEVERLRRYEHAK